MNAPGSNVIDEVTDQDMDKVASEETNNANEPTHEGFAQIYPESEDGKKLFAFLKLHCVPEVAAGQISLLFDIEEDLEKRPTLLYTKTLTGETSFGDLV